MITRNDQWCLYVLMRKFVAQIHQFREREESNAKEKRKEYFTSSRMDSSEAMSTAWFRLLYGAVIFFSLFLEEFFTTVFWQQKQRYVTEI